MTSKMAEEASEAGVRPTGAIKRLLERVPRALLELFALTGLVIVQPLLDVTGKAPDFFLFYRVDRGQILLLVAAIVLLPTAAMWLVEMAALLLAGERVQGLVHLAMLTGLFVLLALELGKKLLPVRGRRLVLAALVVAAMVGVVYRRWPALKLWLRYLAPAPLVFALLFATTSPAAELILPSRLAGGSPMPTLTRPGEPLPPVVMIFFDAFPLQSLLDSKAEVDRKVYPNFAEFAADATWYRNATGVNAWTPYAVPAMLSGRYPDKSKQYQAPIAQAYPDNLFSLFGHYYDLKVFETVTQLCPPKRCGQTGTRSGLGVVAKEVAKLYLNIVAPVDVPVDPASMGESPTPTADTKMGSPTAYFGNLRLDQLGRVDRFMRSISATDRQPTLYFLHLLLPHGPHKYLPDGRIYRDPIGRGPVSKAGTWPDALTKVGHQRQLLQLAYTDKVLGTVIDRLKQQGLYDKSLVLLTADHGTGFSSTVRSRWIGGGNEPTLMWVPLFIKAPHQTSGRVDDRNWEHVDLLPTVADIAGLSVPWNGDGYSQVGPSKRRRTDKWWYDTPGERQVRPGPSYFRQVLGGVTDTLVRAHQRGERGLWQFGVTADWVYRSPRAIGRLAGGPVAAKVKDWSRFETVRPGSSPTPALVVGEVTSGTPPAGSTMVIAVNGRIGGTGGFYPPRPGGRPIAFAAMVPDFLFNPGPGQPQIQAYLATRSGGAVALRPVRLSG